MSSERFLDNPRATDANGKTLGGAIWWFYESDSLTPQAVYADADLDTSLGVSVEADGGGKFPNIFMDATKSYRAILKDALGSTLRDIDPANAAFFASLSQASGADLIGYRYSSDATIITVADALRRIIWVEDFGAVGDGATDCTAAISAAIEACPDYATVMCAGGTYIIDSPLSISRDNFTLDGLGAVFKAKATESFEYTVRGESNTNVTVKNLIIDANGVTRTAVQHVRFMGMAFVFGTQIKVQNCVAQNARGYYVLDEDGDPVVDGDGNPTLLPAVAIAYGDCARSRVEGSIAVNNGVSGFAADGFFLSGENVVADNLTAINCQDTGVVLENCNNSSIDGGVADGCSAGAAISNGTNFDKSGNAVNGMVIRNWLAVNTSGIPILTVGTGKLLNTRINVTLTAPDPTRGIGPAIRLYRNSTGLIDGVILEGIIDTASTQGVLIQAVNVDVSMDIRNTESTCIQCENGSTVTVHDSKLVGGTWGITAGGNATVTARHNTITGQTNHGIYAFDTSTIVSVFDEISGAGVGLTGKDVGATLSWVGRSGSGFHVDGEIVVGPRQAAVTAPSGGATVDSQARTAIADLTARMVAHGLIDAA